MKVSFLLGKMGPRTHIGGVPRSNAKHGINITVVFFFFHTHMFLTLSKKQSPLTNQFLAILKLVLCLKCGIYFEIHRLTFVKVLFYCVFLLKN